ncbi:DUF6962 family protein [Roseibium suaedae]|uniref:Uncharacterized protein n=1 Tax=Roseibium suaedae TaxID=735517 RepID=A0A1M7NZY0_9HYPH|nr:hypothetical protein [Roseibium suaedae]SHN09805.1 hypothetical protein SAMN05444272_4078 [Roseibium suaedae]
MLSELALSALTDVILACELFFLAGLSLRPEVKLCSPAGIWGITLLLIGLASMLGAIDHGFFEAIGHEGHRPMVVITRVVIVLGSLAMICATAAQYLRGKARMALIGLGGLLALWPLFMILTSDDFLSVILYYSIGLLLLAGFSAANLSRQKNAGVMLVGIVLTLAVSTMIPLQSDGFWGLGLYASYHVLLMPIVFLLYLGGRSFRTGC